MYQGVTAWLAAAKDGEQGQGLVEYALIILLVSIIVIAALRLLGTTVSGIFDTVGGAFP